MLGARSWGLGLKQQRQAGACAVRRAAAAMLESAHQQQKNLLCAAPSGQPQRQREPAHACGHVDALPAHHLHRRHLRSVSGLAELHAAVQQRSCALHLHCTCGPNAAFRNQQVLARLACTPATPAAAVCVARSRRHQLQRRVPRDPLALRLLLLPGPLRRRHAHFPAVPAPDGHVGWPLRATHGGGRAPRCSGAGRCVSSRGRRRLPE